MDIGQAKVIVPESLGGGHRKKCSDVLVVVKAWDNVDEVVLDDVLRPGGHHELLHPLAPVTLLVAGQGREPVARGGAQPGETLVPLLKHHLRLI